MGRGTADRKPAFRFILNHSKAMVTNSYLALYPHEKLALEFINRPGLKKSVWTILNDLSPESLSDEGRIYGGGLRKIEPSELMNVPAPQLAEILPSKFASSVCEGV